MHNIIRNIKSYLKKRTNRKNYCFLIGMVFLGFIVVYALIMTIDLIFLLYNTMYTAKLPLIEPRISAKVIAIIAVFSCLPAAIRRLHDIGKSWLWTLPGIIPNIGVIWLEVLYIALLVVPGDKESNKYGLPSGAKEEKNLNLQKNLSEESSTPRTTYRSNYGIIYELDPSNEHDRRKRKIIGIMLKIIASIGVSLSVLLIVMIVKYIIYFLSGWGAIG